MLSLYYSVVQVSPSARRGRRVSASTLWLALAVAFGAHAAVIGTVAALGLSLGGIRRAASSTAHPPPPVDDLELAASCKGNVALATSGRAALCFAPWVDDVDACLAETNTYLWIDLSACTSRNDPSTAIAMVEPKTADKLTPIDPERLLEETKREAKPPPPPPPPPKPAFAQAPPPPPPPPPQMRPQTQVIETIKQKEDKEPENSRFLSENNVSVEKQKVSRGARNEPMVAKAKPEDLTPKQKPKDEPSIKEQKPDRVPGRNEHAPDVPGHLSMRNPGAQSPSQTEQEAKVRGSAAGVGGLAQADGYQQRKGDASIEQQRHERSEIPRGDNGAGGGTPQAPNLKLSDDVLERTVGGGSVDRLDDVESGDETLLSSKRWIYAEFFNRVKRQVAQNWDPAPVMRRRDPTGTVFGLKTRVTEVRVSLSRHGELAKIIVTSPSGVVELDEEARRAFQAAGPFPNPPEALVQNNLITFAFSFSLEMGAPKLDWRLPQAM